MPKLTARIEQKVPFHVLDPLCIMWHGHYVTFMEEAREAFLAKYEMGYLKMKEMDFIEPITNINVNYRDSFHYEDTVVVEIEYIPTKKARINFAYQFYRKSDGKLMTEATSEQHFVRRSTGELEIARPEFYKEWQEKWGAFDE